MSDAQRDYLRSMKTSTGHLNRLVQNLLEISRLERGALALELSRSRWRRRSSKPRP